MFSAICWVFELDQSVFLVLIWSLILSVVSDKVLQPILNEDFLLLGIGRIFRSQFKEASVLFELYFQDYGNLLIRASFHSKILGSFKVHACACIPSQINQTAYLEAISFYWCHFETAVKQLSMLIGILLPFAFIGVVNNEAKCSRESTIVFYCFRVFLSTCLIQVSVNEGLHRV